MEGDGVIVSAEIPDDIIATLAEEMPRTYSQPDRGIALNAARTILWDALRLACGHEPVNHAHDDGRLL